MVWGLIHPDADHWRQFRIYAGSMGPQQGKNVTEMGSFVELSAASATT
jgi:hypothetical protein